MFKSFVIDFTTSAKRGAKIPPNRPDVEHTPIAIALVSVGSNSTVAA